jgi:hypothetical protein
VPSLPTKAWKNQWIMECCIWPCHWSSPNMELRIHMNLLPTRPLTVYIPKRTEWKDIPPACSSNSRHMARWQICGKQYLLLDPLTNSQLPQWSRVHTNHK